tara:strand:- start:159 stop:413 length:255 start_codon:yes stop_codon:yes gene_type:complete
MLANAVFTVNQFFIAVHVDLLHLPLQKHVKNDATLFTRMTQPSSKMTSEIPHAKQLTSAAVWPKLEQCFQRHDLTCPVSGKTQF